MMPTSHGCHEGHPRKQNSVPLPPLKPPMVDVLVHNPAPWRHAFPQPPIVSCANGSQPSPSPETAVCPEELPHPRLYDLQGWEVRVYI